MVTASSVTAVFSLHNPGPKLADNVQAISRQVDQVVIVDDGSTNEIGALLNQLTTLGCQVLTMEKNSGIAAALNTGILHATAKSNLLPDFILTMDQDSTTEEGYVSSLVAAFENAQSSGIQVGMVAPGYVEGLPGRSTGIRGTIVFGDEPIQSGLLIPMSTFKDLGLLMTELFIDGVDSELFLRAKVAGRQVVLAPDARLSHSLGSMTEAKVLGKTLRFRGSPVTVRTAATMRYYYISRNRLILAAKYWRSAPWWVIRGIFLDTRHMVLVTALAPGRVGRLKEAGAGVIDGLRGQTGPKAAKRQS